MIESHPKSRIKFTGTEDSNTGGGAEMVTILLGVLQRENVKEALRLSSITYLLL
jgi:hypothetical protein